MNSEREELQQVPQRLPREDVCNEKYHKMAPSSSYRYYQKLFTDVNIRTTTSPMASTAYSAMASSVLSVHFCVAGGPCGPRGGVEDTPPRSHLGLFDRLLASPSSTKISPGTVSTVGGITFFGVYHPLNNILYNII